MALLSSQGIGTQVHYIPIPMHPYYVSRGHSIKDYPVCEKYYSEAISIPIFFKLDETLILKVFNTIIEILREESNSSAQ